MGKNFEVIFKEFADSETFVLSRGLLEDYKRQAAKEEQERIIKLLLDTRDGLDAILASEFDDGQQLEQLIKGNK